MTITLPIKEIPPDLLEFFEPIEPKQKTDVFSISTSPYPGSHFAVFPAKLIEPMILASPEKVCGSCGAPWARMVESKRLENNKPSDNLKLQSPGVFSRGGNQATYGSIGNFEKTTTGWQPSCQCNAPTAPAIILDPFFGSGTVGQVAIANRRNFIGFELNPSYASELATERLNGTQVRML